MLYQKLSENDERICPRGEKLFAITSNRQYLSVANELVEKILTELQSETVYQDIEDLLEFCANAIHYNLMHWMFAFELIKTLEVEALQWGDGNTNDSEHRYNVAKHILRCAKVWNTVSLAVPFSIQLDGEEHQDQSAGEIWNEMKDKILTSQYALEICYTTACELDDEKNTSRKVGFI